MVPGFAYLEVAIQKLGLNHMWHTVATLPLVWRNSNLSVVPNIIQNLTRKWLLDIFIAYQVSFSKCFFDLKKGTRNRNREQVHAFFLMYIVSWYTTMYKQYHNIWMYGHKMHKMWSQQFPKCIRVIYHIYVYAFVFGLNLGFKKKKKGNVCVNVHVIGYSSNM